MNLVWRGYSDKAMRLSVSLFSPPLILAKSLLTASLTANTVLAVSKFSAIEAVQTSRVVIR